MFFSCSGSFFLRNLIRSAVRSGSLCGITLNISISTGLICLDCSGVTTENSAICVLSSIRYGDSVVLVTLTAILFSIIVYNELDMSKFAVCANLSSAVTVPVVFHSDGWSTRSVVLLVVPDGIIKASSVITGRGFAVVSLEAVLPCIVKCGKCMRPCIVLMSTLLFLKKCSLIIGAVNFFLTTKCSAKISSLIPSISETGANGFSIWPLATYI